MECIQLQVATLNVHETVMFKSAYRVAHCTETGIIKIHNDIVNGIDKDQCTILASLDLSAAFDIVDHDIFIGRMPAYGIRETALKWFQSYLDRRSYRVLINNAFSSAHTLSCGVPQGSVLGARMYTIYVAPLANVINKHSINYHCYADDTQIYIQCANNTTAVQEAITRIQDCITDVSKWMGRNVLKINEDKTEFIIFSAKHYTYDRMSIQIGTNTIQHNNNVKILGVTLDAHMTLEKQISNTCRTSYMQIRRISSIRRYLTVDAVKTLVQATVTLRLDYCNSI